MKAYHKNPRTITTKQFDALAETLDALGDLSPIVHNLETDEVISGNQRMRVFDLNRCKIVLEAELDQPDSQGTVATGYIEWRDSRYAYRAVRWDERTAERANVVANKAGGMWDWDVLANEFEVQDLLDWGFSEIELGLDDLAGGTDDGSGERSEQQGDGSGAFGQDRMLGPYLLGPNDQAENGIFVGDMVELASVIPDESVDLVFSDPPYDEASVSLYGELAKVAARVLKPGGLCAVYVAKLYLNRIMDLMLSDELGYWWMCAIYQPGGGRYIYPRQLAEAWRPILALRKPFRDDDVETPLPRWVRDAYQGQGREKDVHKWQQEVLPPAKYISAWTNEGDVVLDPFCGGGTFPAVCKALNRYYLSFDIDEEAAISARKRVKQAGYDLVAGMSLDDDITPVDGRSATTSYWSDGADDADGDNNNDGFALVDFS